MQVTRYFYSVKSEYGETYDIVVWLITAVADKLKVNESFKRKKKKSLNCGNHLMHPGH